MSRFNNQNDDAELLRALAEQDSEAIQVIYNEYLPMVSQMVYQNQGSEEDSRDLFQDAVMVLYDKAKDPSFVLECKVKTYLYAVSRRLWLKQLHARKKRTEEALKVDIEDSAEDVRDFEEKEQQFKTMDQALVKLGEPCKSLLESFYLQRMSMSEIADNFGYTNPDNAKTQKYKCLNRLKKIFFEQYKQRENQ